MHKQTKIEHILNFKILFFVITLWFSLIIAGCWDKPHLELTFDNFYWNFYTTNSFHISETNTKWLTAWLLQNDIINTYTQTNTTWYVDSIVIIKKLSSKSLKDFVTDDIQKIQLDWYSSDNIESTNIRCKDTKIEMNIVNSELEQNLNTIFFTQAFFAYTWQIYIVSYSTQNKQERDLFTANVSKINCK